MIIPHLCHNPLLRKLKVHLLHPSPCWRLLNSSSLPSFEALQLSFKSTPQHSHPVPQPALGAQQTPLCHNLCSLPHFLTLGARTNAMQLMNPNIYPLLLGCHLLLKASWGQFPALGLLSGKSNSYPSSDSSTSVACFFQTTFTSAPALSPHGDKAFPINSHSHKFNLVYSKYHIN